MKKELAWKIFKVFSILLIIDFTLIPFGLSLLGIGEECSDYAICVASLFCLLLIFILIWLITWTILYIIFFMGDYRNKEFKEGVPFLIQWYVRYIQNIFRRPDDWRIIIVKSAPILIVLALCFAIVFTFCNGIFDILNSLLSGNHN